MPRITTPDGIHLHVKEVGAGTPMLFIHEFGGNHASWEPQLRHFSRRHRCITYAACGYPPSDVPDDMARYSQAIAVADAIAVLDALGIARAHIVGLSMGGFATVHFGLRHPDRALSLAVASAGRVQLQNKDPRDWQEFADRLATHSDLGAALTMRGVQARLPSFWDLEAELKRMPVPTLVIVGDEDDHCLQPGIFLKKTIPACGLAVFTKTGHTLNLEEPARFNGLLTEFVAQVEAGAWGLRDPRALPGEIIRTRCSAPTCARA